MSFVIWTNATNFDIETSYDYLVTMTFKPQHKTQKQIHFKPYQHLWQLERKLLSFASHKEWDIQISILGKVAQYEADQSINNPNGINVIKTYWKTLFGDSVNFGSFYNPEIGNLFIVGDLASTFLHEINGKPIAILTAGPYGIFRGLGLSQTQTTMYLKSLNNDNYLLIIRASKNEIERVTT